MQIKLITDYALRILTYLSVKKSVTNSKEISNHLDIPQKYVLGIGRKLKAENFVNIINGPYGGYKINKNPEEILLFDVISIFKDDKINCHSDGKKESGIISDAAVICFYSELQSIVEKKLRAETLAGIINKAKKE